MKTMVLMVAVEVADEVTEAQMRSQLVAMGSPIRSGLTREGLRHHVWQLAVKDVAWQARRGITTGWNLYAAIKYRKNAKNERGEPLRLNFYEL